MAWYEPDPLRGPLRASTLPVRFAEGPPAPANIYNQRLPREPIREFSRRDTGVSRRNVRDKRYRSSYPDSSSSDHSRLSSDSSSSPENIVRRSPKFDDYHTVEEDEPRDRDRSRRRPRSHDGVRRHSRLYVEYDSADESDDSDAINGAFTFVIPRRSASVFSQGSTLAGFDSKEEVIAYSSTSSPSVRGLRPEICYNILRAEYAGEGFVGGEHRANLTVVKDARRHPYSLYRWVHFHSQAMKFDEFRDAVVGLPGLLDAERSSIARLFGRVKRKFDKPYRASKTASARMMVPAFLQEEVSDAARPKQKPAESQMVTWMCVPYFSLDKYAADIAKLDDGAHPMRTLIQARFALVDKKRDMQQAVCNIPNSEPEYCFHVPQIWYLVLGDSLIVTCAPLPLASLRGVNISLSPISTPEPYKDEARKILISYRASVLWSFRLDECQTWFGLMTKFSEFPLRFRFMYRGRLITPNLWPRIINQAKHSTGNLRISFELSTSKKPQNQGILRRRADPSITGTVHVVEPQDNDDNIRVPAAQSGHPATSFQEGTTSTSLSDDFFVLTWLKFIDDNKNITSDRTDPARLRQDLEAMDSFLQDETNLVQSLAYKGCRLSSHAAILAFLQQEADSLSSSSRAGDTSEANRRSKHGWRVDIFNTVESVFELFLPISFRGPTIDQFWGAVHIILGILPETEFFKENPPAKPKHKRKKGVRFDDAEYQDLREEFEEILQHMQPLKDLLSQAPLGDRVKIEIPDELVKAWLHIVMTLVFAAQEWDIWRGQSRNARKLLEKGSRMLMQGFVKRSLLKDSVVMPQELASLISLKLLHGISNGNTEREITQTYLEYISKLESGIEAKPLDREHQDKLVRLKEELTVIEQHLQWQKAVIAAVQREEGRQKPYDREILRMRSGDPDHTYSRKYTTYAETQQIQNIVTNYDEGRLPMIISEGLSKLGSTDLRGYRDLLVSECLDTIEMKIGEFEGMRMRADNFVAYNLWRIDLNKDRHDNAIYAFTVVTIIFLPLSTVAGILGMNTNDIRNMEIDQWVFWATAIPLLSIVMFLCLLWTGEIDNFWRGFKNLWRGEAKIRQASAGVPVESQRYGDRHQPAFLRPDYGRMVNEVGYYGNNDERYYEGYPPPPPPPPADMRRYPVARM